MGRLNDLLSVTELISIGVRIWTQRHCGTRAPVRDYYTMLLLFYWLGSKGPVWRSDFRNTLSGWGQSTSPSPLGQGSFLDTMQSFSGYFLKSFSFYSSNSKQGSTIRKLRVIFQCLTFIYVFREGELKRKSAVWKMKHSALASRTWLGQSVTQITLCTAWP